MIDKAMVGNVRPLLDYLKEHLNDVVNSPKHSPAEWFQLLPAWFGRGKKRALKEWCSQTERHNWSIALCAKAVNQAMTVYITVLGVPPVVEGVDTAGVLMPVPDGLDLYTTFLLCMHVGYCKYLNPPVEEGTDAFKNVLQYMNTRVVKQRLLRSVRSSRLLRYNLLDISRHYSTMLFHDTIHSTGNGSHDSSARRL